MKRLLLVLILVISIPSFGRAWVGSLPNTEGQRARYGIQIDIRQAYISGIMAMLYEDGAIKASIINEFGVSAMDFVYYPDRDKVKLIKVLKKLDHWYIRRVLKADLRQLIHNMEAGQMSYKDEKYKITYTLSNVDVDVNEKPFDTTP